MKETNKLYQKTIDAAKPGSEPYSIADGGGLVLFIRPGGERWWRFRYRYLGVPKMISLGIYPDTSLAEARVKLAAKRAMLAADPPVDPSAERQARTAAQADSFQTIAAEWFADSQADNAPVTRKQNQYFVDRLNSRIGKRLVAQISTPDMLAALKALQKAHGAHAAARARGIASKVFCHAIASGKATSDPAQSLKGSLKTPTITNRPAITKPAQFGELLRKIDAFSGQPSTRAYLQLLALNFTRPTEIRLGKWSEVDFDKKLWVIPSSRMKMRNKTPGDFLLPLSAKSVEILTELREQSGNSPWVFPQARNPHEPIGQNAGGNALKKLGYDGDTHSCHSFRTTANTILHELGFDHETIETALAHARPGVSGIYNRSHLLDQRREMLQSWADYLDQVRTDSNVIPIGSKAS